MLNIHKNGSSPHVEPDIDEAIQVIGRDVIPYFRSHAP